MLSPTSTPWLAKASATGTVLLVSALIVFPTAASTQGVVVDEGTFAVSLEGRMIGTEDFAIRRAGVDRDDALFATADVDLEWIDGDQQVRLLLRATPADGVPKCEGADPCYQVDIVGVDAKSVRLGLAGRRYVARIVDPVGEEIREFPAAPGTRILESGIAHLYYFLRDLREGDESPVLSPGDRARATLRAGPSILERIQLGPNVVEARRVEFAAGDDVRIVWYDRLGRVLRVSVPASDYLAERTDLVG